MILHKKAPESISITARYLREGKIVIIPTDTVYGFSGIVDIKGSQASFRTDCIIRNIKGRSETKPLIQLISKPEDIHKYTDDIIPDSLLKKWPGALTIIVHIKNDSPLADYAETVAFRCPGDKWLRNIIEECGAPIYSTSVNRSGNPVLERIDCIKNEFEKEVSIIVDDGDKVNAKPSTLVILRDNQVSVLRQGSVKV